MKALKAGAVLLSIWSVVNLLVAVGVTILTLRGRTPITMMVGDEPGSPRLHAIVYAQAALCNPCIAALCLLVLVITWSSLVRRAHWAFWALVATLAPLQAFAFVSDGYLGHRNLGANIGSTLLLGVALSLCDYGRRGARSATLGPARG
jgi:hypothetical protein